MLRRVSVTVVPRSEARRARRAASSSSSWDCPRLHRQQTLPLQLFAGELTGAADGFRLLPGSPLGRFFVMAAELHFAEDALALHLLLQHPKGLVDIVVTYENLHAAFLLDRAVDRPNGRGARAIGARSGTQFECRWHPRYEATSIFELRRRWAPWLPIGRNGEFGTSPFFGSSSDEPVLA